MAHDPTWLHDRKPNAVEVPFVDNVAAVPHCRRASTGDNAAM
jgi:hypothetical protein